MRNEFRKTLKRLNKKIPIVVKQLCFIETDISQLAVTGEIDWFMSTTCTWTFLNLSFIIVKTNTKKDSKMERINKKYN